MPEISRFFGIVIAMYHLDHPPAHFHAKYGGETGVFSIDTLDLIEGKLPARVRSLVLEWASEHRAELKSAWEAVSIGERPNKIEPLK